MAETWTLDGLALNDGTTFQLREGEIDLTPPKQRPEWIGAADSEYQDLVRNPLHENRVIVLPLQIVPTATKDLAFDKVGQIVDRLAKASATRGGIDLTWTAHGSARTVTFDVLAGEISEFHYDRFLSLGNRARLAVTLTCKPYGLGTETLTGTTSSSTPFVTATVTGTGDIANEGRLIVTDTATQSRRHLEWGLEGPLTYNAATFLLVDSDDMVTSGFGGTQTTQAGAYDPNATGNTCIGITARSAIATVAGVGNLSHVGSFRVKARVYSTDDTVSVRLAWRAADGPMTSNQWATHRGGNLWQEVDLGMIHVPAALSGTQRWTGQVDVKTSSGTATVRLDYLVLVPTVSGYGKARAVYAYSAGSLAALDQFVGTTAASALNGRTADLGGTWATSGAATDFVFSDDLGGEQIKRTTISDASPRFAILGSATFTDTDVSAELVIASSPTATASPEVRAGLIGRWTDSSNHLYGVLLHGRAGTQTYSALRIYTVVTGTTSLLANKAIVMTPGTVYTGRLLVFASGRVIFALLNDAGTTTLSSVEGFTSAAATGGALASGKPGVIDHSTATNAITRYYDDIAVATPSAEPIVVYSGRNMQVRHDDTIRQDSTGTYTGRPSSYRGSRFLVPVGTSRVLVKVRRNDIDTAGDENVTDATQVQIGVTPRYLVVPR